MLPVHIYIHMAAVIWWKSAELECRSEGEGAEAAWVCPASCSARGPVAQGAWWIADQYRGLHRKVWTLAPPGQINCLLFMWMLPKPVWSEASVPYRHTFYCSYILQGILSTPSPVTTQKYLLTPSRGENNTTTVKPTSKNSQIAIHTWLYDILVHCVAHSVNI